MSSVDTISYGPMSADIQWNEKTSMRPLLKLEASGRFMPLPLDIEQFT